jgi:hypothetical protein
VLPLCFESSHRLFFFHQLLVFYLQFFLLLVEDFPFYLVALWREWSRPLYLFRPDTYLSIFIFVRFVICLFTSQGFYWKLPVIYYDLWPCLFLNRLVHQVSRVSHWLHRHHCLLQPLYINIYIVILVCTLRRSPDMALYLFFKVDSLFIFVLKAFGPRFIIIIYFIAWWRSIVHLIRLLISFYNALRLVLV